MIRMVSWPHRLGQWSPLSWHTPNIGEIVCHKHSNEFTQFFFFFYWSQSTLQENKNKQHYSCFLCLIFFIFLRGCVGRVRERHKGIWYSWKLLTSMWIIKTHFLEMWCILQAFLIYPGFPFFLIKFLTVIKGKRKQKSS